MIVRPILVMVLLLGVALALLALVGLALLGFWRLARVLPTDSSTTSAWIGFAGSVVGALLTILAGFIALYPAYRQMQEASRGSAVQTGQILRSRYKAAKDELNILLKSVHSEEIPKLLALGPGETDREMWMKAHPETVQRLKQVILPRIEEVYGDVFDATVGTELPDLDRRPYMTALDRYRGGLYTILDGIPRAPNGTPGPMLTPEQWRDRVAGMVRFVTDDFGKAHLDYNNRINNALNLFRYQILQADRDALGSQTWDQFVQTQKQIEDLEKAESSR